VEDLFPLSLRLSIHPHSNVKKFGFNLVECESVWRTPWHAVTVRRADGSFSLMHRCEALSQGFRETADEEGLIFFE
jgi:pyoverdine/dityrosine biosynthesis protein Dit1